MVDKWVYKIRRLSLRQLRALKVLVDSRGGVIEAKESSQAVGLKGKALGGVFSSLARQRVGGESLVEAWGRGESRGIRWKLNEKVIDKKTLLQILREIVG